MPRFSPLLLLLLGVLAASAFKMEASDPVQLKFPQMLEISTRPWLYSLSQQHSKNITRFRDIPLQEFQVIQKQGFQVVWMMGVWELGAYGLNFDRTNPQLLAYYPTVLPGCTQADIIGSPYAPTEYTTNPQLGSDADLAWLKQTLNSMGLKLMLDFVPNHSAVDAPWTKTNIEYYVRAPKGTNPPYDPSLYLPSGIAYGSAGWGGSWQDTAQLNYWNPDLVQQRVAQLLTVAKYSDYIRCDMAFLLLNDNFQQNWGNQVTSWGYKRPSQEFWAMAIPAVKFHYPSVKFLAEVYYPWQSTLQAWFDFTYDKQLYDRLGNGNLDDIRGYISGNSLQYISQNAHFVENHDEPRAAAFFGSNWRADAAALVSMTLPGMRFYNLGQQQGYKNKLDVHLRRGAPEPVVDWVSSFYTSLYSIINMPVFHNGTWTYLGVGSGSDNPASNWRLMAWKWVNSNMKVVCIINYSDTQAQGRVVLSDAVGQNGGDSETVQELLSGQSYVRSASEMRTQGLSVIVNSWYAQIFVYY